MSTDVFGASGRAMLKAPIAGERDRLTLADFAQGRLRDKRTALAEVLVGRFTDHHAFLLRNLLTHLELLELQIGEFDRRIAEATEPMTAALERLGTIPGVARGSDCTMYR